MPALPDRIQFRRSYRLEIGTKKIESVSGSIALRIAFEVVRKNTSVPNAAKIQIYGLNRESRAGLESLNEVVVRLSIGYQDSIKQIFFGALSRASSVHDGTEWITTVSGGDGTVAMSTSRIRKSFKRGTPLGTVLGSLVDAMKIGRGNFAIAQKALLGKTLSHGLTISGPVTEELNAFTQTNGLEWSIQDGDFFVSKIVPDRPATIGPLISPKTGLIGSPVVQAHNQKVKKNAQGLVSLKALILPELLPGLPFRLESSSVTGNMIAVETRHTGDSTEQDWYVEVKGKLL